MKVSFLNRDIMLPLQSEKDSTLKSGNMNNIAASSINPLHQGIIHCMDKVYEIYSYV